MANNPTPKKRRQQASGLNSDPHFTALMNVIAGLAGNGQYVDILARAAIDGTHETLRQLIVSTRLDDSRVSSYAIVSSGVERWNSIPKIDTKTDAALKLLRAVNDDQTPDGPLAGADDVDVLMALFNEYADAGMLFGATLMYALMKGGAK